MDVEEGYWVGVTLVVIGNKCFQGKLGPLSRKPQLLSLAPPPPVLIPGDNRPIFSSPLHLVERRTLGGEVN